MITPNDLIVGLAEKNRMLTQKNEEYVKLVEVRAQAERAHNIAVARKTMELKADGYSIGLIDKLVKGDKLIADLKYDADLAEGVERACLQAIKDLRSAIDTYRSLLAWQKAEMLNTQ